MKNLFKLLAIFTAFAFTSCTTSLNTTAPVDDVYSYGPTKVVVEKPASSPSTNTSTPSADNKQHSRYICSSCGESPDNLSGSGSGA
jgi:transposase-like protein